MPRTRGLSTEETMSLFESLLSNCSGTPVECSSDGEMSPDDSSVALSFDFQYTENADSSSDKDMEEQSFLRIWKKRNASMVTPISSLNSGFVEQYLIIL
ncbi:hypothetical protein NPIL_248751 [Nephila pilipes]|uniref:Uncharacterized protein n=1 Tax=Nephila pilipes TaxID=299642 RepID=A0A8X6TPJ9_NEPPI|nr:hypothetical protein NPIL_248751 [Nephila pilipes]